MPSENNRDELFTCLASARRRALVDALTSKQASISIQELARQVAAREKGISVDDLSNEAVQEVYFSLHHVHLPKLASAGVIEYDPEQNEVGRGPTFEPAAEILDTVL
jgi:hypothetical protein